MKLGTLEKVELRDYWKNESSDFTPWLANEENIQLLGEAIGMELEVQGQEEAVGQFRADIRCKDILTNRNVVIENQLDMTDHKHLGQIITYAAGLDALSIIWIASKFNENHRAAIDWLNNITDETINFFGIEIALYKIGDSQAAPMFDIVAKPNEWTKTVREVVRNADLREHQKYLLEYWQAFQKYLTENGSPFKTQNPRPQHSIIISIGIGHFFIVASVIKKDNFLRIELILNADEAKSNFKLLKEKYEDESKKEISKDIIWAELPDAKISSIYIKKVADVLNTNDWQNQHEWFKVNVEKFIQYFVPKIKLLKSETID